MAKTLEFQFTPVDEPGEAEATQNAHAKSTTFVPEVVAALQKQFGDAVGDVFLYANEHTVYVSNDRVVEICRFLRDEQNFRLMTDLGGIDRLTDEDRFEIFYALTNLEDGKRIRVKTRIDENATAPTMTGVFRAANWNERECFDMFGIRFDGHPDLRRMYMPEDFEYHPLRKEFPLLGIPGSLPLPPQTPEAGLTMDPYPAAHGSETIKSYDEAASEELS